MSARRVLVVDDSEVTRAILARTLRGAGFEVLEARDGVEGALLAFAEHPSVVITDLEMPMLDGFPLLRLLKADPASAGIPVLILTGHPEAASRFWSLRTGADAYLTKDHRPQQLVATVTRLAAAAAPPVSSTAAPPPAPLAAALCDAAPVLAASARPEATASVAEAPVAPAPALPASPPSPSSPPGALEVLARVARQLDTSLLQATVTNTLLERGMAVADLQEACRVALATLGEVVDARFLAVALAEQDAVTVHIQLDEAVSAAGVVNLEARLLGRLEVVPGLPVRTQVSGARRPREDGPRQATAGFHEAEMDLDTVVWAPLAIRSERSERGERGEAGTRVESGVLAVLPRDPWRFARGTSDLLQSVLGQLSLVLDNARLAERLRELSSLDGLTRQLNQRVIVDRLVTELERARRYHLPLAVVLCDLDHFKQVNDTHGHLAGDAVLREGASVLRRTLRATDLLGRYGGEEFLAILPQVEGDAARQAAERLRRALAEHEVALPGGAAVRITGSFGVATLAEHAEISAEVSGEGLLALADLRLYEAKAAGRNRVRP